MDDGMLEVAFVRQVEKPGFFRKLKAYGTVARLMLGGVKNSRGNIVVLRGSRVKMEVPEDVVWDFDGEEGTRGDIRIEAAPRHIKLFVPEKKKI